MAGACASYHLLLLRAALAAHGNDFGRFYYAAHAWMAGGSLYDRTIATRLTSETVTVDFLNMNPPHFHLLVLPFTMLPLQAAYLAWLASSVLCGIVAAAIVVRRVGIRLRPWHVMPAICGSLVLAPTAAVTVTGQVTGFLMLPLALAWNAAHRSRWAAAGAWIGVTAAIKPFLLLFIPVLVAMKRPGAALAAIAAAIASFLPGLVVFGWQAQVEWLRALGAVSWVWARMNGSLLALFSRSLSMTPDFVPLVNAPGMVIPLWVACSAGVAVATSLAAQRSVDHAFAAVVLGALLISPLGWVYYAWMALPGCLALWHVRPSALAVASLLPLSVPLVALMIGQPRPLASVMIASSYAWGMFGLWLAVLLTRAPTSKTDSR